jgi:hypothetical protein
MVSQLSQWRPLDPGVQRHGDGLPLPRCATARVNLGQLFLGNLLDGDGWALRGGNRKETGAHTKAAPQAPAKAQT